MSDRLRMLLLVGLLLVPRAGWAQGSDITICGIDLQTLDAFAWSGFASGRGEEPIAAGSRLSTVNALREELTAEATDWPGDLARDAQARLTDFATNTIVLADWVLETTDFGRAFFVFSDDARVELPVTATDGRCAESPDAPTALAEFAKFVWLVQRAGTELIGPSREGLAKDLGALETIYDRYLFEGFPMLPWEAAVNSLFLAEKHISVGPPRSQVVFMHPSAGVLANVESDTDGDIGGTLLVEAIGFVRYSSDYRDWWGASIIGSFPTDREPGIGFALNYREFKLGVTWHDDTNGPYDGAAVFLGIDLYQFVGEQKRRYKGYRRKLDTFIAGARE